METAAQEVQRITRFEDTPEYRHFAARKQALLSDTDNPYFIAHDSPLTDKSFMDGQWVLNFGSYNYAGMSGRQEVSEAAIDAIRRYGTSASGSRLLAGEKTLDRELERAIAQWKHTEDALVLEDSENGLLAAHNGKIPAICIPDMKYPAAQYRDYAVYIAGSARDVITYFS